MSKTNLPVSLKDTKELRKVILENPDLPLLIFCGEFVNTGDYPYMSATNVRVEIDELTLYKDIWLNKEDFEDAIRVDLENLEKCQAMTDEEFDKFIQEKIELTEFVKAIMIYAD